MLAQTVDGTRCLAERYGVAITDTVFVSRYDAFEETGRTIGRRQRRIARARGACLKGACRLLIA